MKFNYNQNFIQIVKEDELEKITYISYVRETGLLIQIMAIIILTNQTIQQRCNPIQCLRVYLTYPSI